MSRTDTITMRGASGNAYKFDVYPWGTPFKAMGAVYVVLKKRVSEYDVIYIGQTGDLSERFDDHHRQACFSQYGKTHIGVHLEGNRRTRLFKEKDLIENYNPVCNRT